MIKGFGDTDLNAARYGRWHGVPPNAAGRDTRRGFNDPTLFVAQATREQVAGFAARGHDFRVSWAIPMEIVLAPPHMVWNPYRLPELGKPRRRHRKRGQRQRGRNGPMPAFTRTATGT